MKVLLRIFPRRFRDRYGQEIVELMRESDRPVRDLADVVAAALSLRMRSAFGVIALAVGAGAVLSGCAILGSALAIGSCSSAAAGLRRRPRVA